jgi:hypothetical protein
VTRDNTPPELSGEWDDEPAGPSRLDRRRRLLQTVGIIALASLVLPGFLVTWSTSHATARVACEIAVGYYAPAAVGSQARFELLPLDTLGWVCHAQMADGFTLRVASLGPIPGQPVLRPLTGT